MRPFDHFEARIDPAQAVEWPGGGGFQPVELRVNGVPLIDLVRAAELPFAEREYDEVLAAGGEMAEGLGPRGSLAGDYLYPNAGEVFLPSVNLLGAPFRHGFDLDPGDPRDGKSLLLQCTCGVTECWFLLATITVTDEAVAWSGFRQFHRDWALDLGPYTFERRVYERELWPRGPAPGLPRRRGRG